MPVVQKILIGTCIELAISLPYEEPVCFVRTSSYQTDSTI